jgi:hypothetical protein
MLASDPNAKFHDEDDRKYYTTELTLGEYIERAQMDADRARMEEAGKRWEMQTARERRLAALLAEDRPCINYETEDIMKEIDAVDRECKVATNDKVVFEPGKAPKFDGGKAPMHLIPVKPLKDVAEVLAFGADKYGAQSWREGEMIAWSRSYSAILRHLMAFHSGEDNDPETGKSHLAHAACCVLMLLEHTYVNPAGDDRFKDGAEFNK